MIPILIDGRLCARLPDVPYRGPCEVCGDHDGVWVLTPDAPQIQIACPACDRSDDLIRALGGAG